MSDPFDTLSAALASRYRLDREIGRGGMGIVFLAHDHRHDRPVAVKVLRPEVASEVSTERFLREIRIAAQLQHPNILPVLDSGDAHGLTYYVMPFVEGESLRERLDRESTLPIAETLVIAREMAEAIAFAHDRGVIHRDIKPANILLSAGHALLTDFGVAHALATHGDKLTQTGVALGTPAYMSPEQGAGTGVDHRADIYSLGCVVYEMLVGQPPYTGTFIVVMSRKAVDPVPGIRVVRDTVPVHVEDAVMRALAKDPADRYASGREFALALGNEISSARRANELLRASRKRWLAAGAAGAVGLIGGAYVLLAGVPFSSRPMSLAGARYAQLTSEPGVEWFPSLAPDGRWLVYAGQQAGNRDIYLQAIGAENAINLTRDSPADDDQPAFSPDGERIAFRSARDGGGIFVMGRTGEAVRRVATRGFHPTWSPDGARIAYATENMEMNPGNSETNSELWVVALNGGSARKLETIDAVMPSWSPNGHRIAFTQRLGRPAQADIVTIDPDGGVAVPLVEDPATDWNPTWSADGRYVYFSSSRGGSMNLWRIAVDEQSGKARGAPEPLTTPATFLAHPVVSRDGSRIAYTSALVSQNIQRLAFDAVSATVLGEPQSVTTGSRRFSSPDPSADGAWVAYYTLNQPEGDIYISRPDGTGRRQLTSDTAIDRVPRWSPDGQWLATFSNRAGPLQLWRIRADGSDLQRISTTMAGYLAWSPDGRRIATVTGANLSDSLILLDAFGPDSQRPELLRWSTEDQFLVNSWSPDGTRLAGQVGVAGGMGRGVAVYDLTSRRYEKLTNFGEWPVWLPDGKRILFVANGNSFWIVHSGTRQVRRIWSVDRDVIGPPRMTRDGRTLYFSRRATEGDIWLLSVPRQD